MTVLMGGRLANEEAFDSNIATCYTPGAIHQVVGYYLEFGRLKYSFLLCLIWSDLGWQTLLPVRERRVLFLIQTKYFSLIMSLKECEGVIHTCVYARRVCFDLNEIEIKHLWNILCPVLLVPLTLDSSTKLFLLPATSLSLN